MDDVKEIKEFFNRAFIFIADAERDSFIDLDGDPVSIAVMYDVQGFSPHIAALGIIQTRHRGSKDEALEIADSILTEHALEDTDYLSKLEEEWGELAIEILTENFDGMAWTLTPEESEEVLSGLTYRDEGQQVPMDIEFFSDED